MKRADAQRAIDEALADSLKNLFDVLERNLVGESSKIAAEEFTRGVAKADEAHAIAGTVIEKIFSE